ncbi:MAG: GIY-YIG nuclease family protein [Alphaproteobacteria bacterium]|nr:GIY-YIG nuclease family protein [Alphaproteobacteria bacterium]
MKEGGYVYILANQRNGTLYTGVTSNLVKRIYEHKNENIEGFTKKYNVKNVVYYEYFDDIENAIKREKRIKKYKREAKIKLIEKDNPNWDDLYEDICK